MPKSFQVPGQGTLLKDTSGLRGRAQGKSVTGHGCRRHGLGKRPVKPLHEQSKLDLRGEDAALGGSHFSLTRQVG